MRRLLRTRLTSRVSMLLLLFCAASLAIGCNKKKPDPVQPVKKELTKSEGIVSNLVETEDLILDLTPRLSKFAKWFEANSAGQTTGAFAELENCEIVGLTAADPSTLFHSDSNHPAFVETANWPTATAASTDETSNPWGSLESLNAKWETTKFGVLSANFSSDGKEFTLHTKAESRGRSNSHVLGLKSHQDLVFESTPGTKARNLWRLKRWEQLDFFVERSPNQLFKEVFAELVKDELTLANAQRSFKDEIIIKSSRKGGQITLPVPEVADFESLTSNHIFPAVSVVDYNNDGRDDLFLTSRWGPTQMLEMQADGTYVDVAEEIGLREEHMVNCILFFDVDNDGDKDCLMGRPMESAKYFRNDNGKYKNVTRSKSDLGKQYFVCGISATDVNRDGLIDIYLSNYPPLNHTKRSFSKVFLGDEEQAIFNSKRSAATNRWLDMPGSANVLLMNRGDGQLERVPFDDMLSQWRCSYQSVWTDIDNDGDDDLYVCNDFAPDAMLRNDTPRGAAEPVFVDVTKETLRGKGIGFGMGASFGDFDADGDFDLYVSNMYSKAGKRIANSVGEVDLRIKAAAAGSFLFVNQLDGFDQQAGSDESQFHVNQIGWSYGGQFADFNNDGQLDLYVPTGYYTAPEEIATEVDT